MLCAQRHAYILLSYTRIDVVVDAHNEVVPGIHVPGSIFYTHDDIRVHTTGECFTTSYLLLPQHLVDRAAVKWKVERIIA